MSRGAPFLRFFEPAIDPSLVDDPNRLLDFLNNSDKERLPRLLQRRDDKGYSLLHYAAESNQPESLVMLLVNHADPNIRSSSGTNEVTPLHIAAKCGNLACLERLVESGGNPLAKDTANKMPRDYAQEFGQELCLEFLQKQSAERVQQETEDLQGLLSFLQSCFESGDIDSVLANETFNKLFISDVIATPSSSSFSTKNTSLPKMSSLENVFSRNCNLLNNSTLLTILNRVSRDIPVFLHSASLLHAACHYNNTHLIVQILDRFPSLLYSATSEGYTPIHIAVCHGNIDSLRLLIETHMSINRQRSSSGALPRPRVPSTSLSRSCVTSTITGHNIIHFAVALNNLDILTYLIQYQKPLLLSLDEQLCGYTPLHLAVHLKLIRLANFLLGSGALPNTMLTSKSLSTMSLSPLAEATVNVDKDMVELLVKYGAEDRRHDALNLCFRQDIPNSNGLIPPLLGSLVKCDEVNTKHLVLLQGRKEGKRMKMGLVDWGNLDMIEIKSEWVIESLSKCPFLKQQSLEPPFCFDYISSLHLCKNNLTNVPIEVFHLKNLTHLNLSANKLIILPDVIPTVQDNADNQIWPCPNLSRLNISSNRLKELPEYLFEIPKLTFLDASKNAIEHLSFSIWCSPKLNNFNCSHNCIMNIPTNWPDVKVQYQIINPALMSPPVSVLSSPRSKGSSRKFSSDITGNTSSMKMDSRHSDSSSTDEAASITPARARQTRLYDRLNVCNANLTIEWDTPEGREELFDGLNSLNLSFNQIKSIPPNLPCLCPKLTKLDLSNNDVSELALPRAVPAGLRKLDISNNCLLALDSYRSHVEPLPCTNPKTLAAITDGKITFDSKFFCAHRLHNHLISLDILNASYNEISEVKLYSPIISVSEGPHSRSSKIREIDVPLLAALASASSKSAESVRHLAKLACPLLTRLVLHHNNIPEVPLSVCEMTNLNSLDLSYNPIIELRPELGKLSNIWDFPLDDLKLISPPHNIIERGKAKDIIGFLWSLLQRARPYHRMKLMVVGKASRGKTTLLKKISEKGQRGREDNVFLSRMNPESRAFSKNLATVGIVVSDWTYTKKIQSDQTQTGLRNITFMTWDFGGQEEYYATHQCFLSRRSLYIVVWNVLDGRSGVEELKPWLLNIQARAPNSPVIIVGTHYDKVKKSLQKAELRENLDLIDKMYGSGSSLMRMKHGFPTIMESVVVSSTNGKNINDLRDKIFNVACNVKENTVAGRAVGGGRNPEYRLLMDQLVPASYLQLEDSVRNVALNLRYHRKPPVLTYKEFRDQIYADARPLIGRDIDDKELEQAVRFLHENGTLIHYDDPFLKDLYFVDPQWLSDMLAHIVTVREINPFIKDGVMKIKDFALLFNEKDFPIKWQKEYLRLLTTFEVAVEFKKGKLLIPSHLPEIKPQIPKFYAPEDTVFLPPLRHTFLLAFVPSGFWPRLMSRVLSDKSIIKLAQDGCGLTDNETKLLKWTKWRTGMVLKFGNLTLLSLEEFSGRLFSGNGSKMKILMEANRWDEHSLDITVYGINIEVPDIYPLLRYAELHPRLSVKGASSTATKKETCDTALEQQEETIQDDMYYEPPPTTNNRARRWTLTDKIGNAVNKVRTYTSTSQAQENKLGNVNIEDTFMVLNEDGDVPPHVDGSSPSSDESSDERDMDEGKVERAKKVLRMEDVNTKFEKLKKLRAQGVNRVVDDNNDLEDSVNFKPTPTLTEENNDKMRAGLISKIVDHITLLVEDWFAGVRPRILVVPCPHCSCGLPPGNVPLMRSYSLNPQLRPPSNSIIAKDYPYTAKAPNLSSVASTTTSQTGKQRSFWTIGRRNVEEGGVSEATGPADTTFYAFNYDECVMRARDNPVVTCPNHQDLPLEFISPDTLFLSEGRNILLGPDELTVLKDEALGRGAFATVYKARLKKGPMIQGIQDYEDCVVKALGRQAEHDEEQMEEDEEHGGGGGRPKPINKASFLSGFNNLKKELSILSPLKHANVVRLFGVSIRPLGLVLELAVRGDLKSVLKLYKEAQNHIQPPAIQCVVSQIAAGLVYLHSLRIIYRDLKSENILVWSFPTPHAVLSPTAQLGMDAVKVKISDYGISQFVTSQGAKGHVGTPGFMAPEILKYLGKEAYNEKVDIFSYAMVMYEIITFRVPFEHLTPNQANQANESGTRPTLKKKDLPCPVLIRELMVWCWQQEEKDRPSASEIIGVAEADQFLRLADAIRINNFGSQVTGCCCRIVKSSYQKNAITPMTPASFFSPRYTAYPQSNNEQEPKPNLVRELQTISSSQPYRPKVDLENRSVSLGGKLTECVTFDSSMCPIENETPNIAQAQEQNEDNIKLPEPRLENIKNKSTLTEKLPPIESTTQQPTTGHVTSVSVNTLDEIVGVLPSGPGLELLPAITPNMPAHPTSLLPLKIKDSSIMSEEESQEEEHKMYQIWTISCYTHCSVVTVMEYCGQFIKIEDIDLGDSPVLCIAMVNDTIWMGFEIGYLSVYDANTYDLLAQVWLRQGIAVWSIAYIPQLATVYVGMADGSIKAYNDTINVVFNDEEYCIDVVKSLQPTMTYQDIYRVCVKLLPVVTVTANNETNYQLWVGQNNSGITVLNAKNLSIVDFVDSEQDKTPIPRCFNDLSFAYLTCSCVDDGDVERESDSYVVSGSAAVLVYGALQHGQYISCWDAVSREIVACVDCKELLPKREESLQISALHFSSGYLYVGLVSGEVIVLAASSLSVSTILHCHRSHVNSFLPIDLKMLLPTPTNSPAFTPALSPMHPFLMTDYNSVTFKTGPKQLMSFGTGFRAYYESSDSIDYSKSSFALVWESGEWNNNNVMSS